MIAALFDERVREQQNCKIHTISVPAEKGERENDSKRMARNGI